MGQPATILIVDDEPFNLDYLEQELEDGPYRILRACNGGEALSQVQAESPDLVLLDIMMPVLDGFEVLTRLKANPATRHIPVIVISASDSLSSVVRGIQLGAEDYLPKPFETTLLHARISSSLEKKRLRDLEHVYLEALEREMQIAREIQQGFLPPELPRVPGWDVAVSFRAAREVAGDFYDAFVLHDGSLACVIGDVCGKGVGAALFMTLFRSLVRATLTTDAFCSGAEAPASAERLQQVVSFVNRYVAETHAEADMFATMFLAVFAPGGGHVRYVNCGHEPPLWRSGSGEITSLRPTGPAVGAIPDAKYRVKELEMQPGDMLLVVTDGIPDAINSRNELFSYDCVRSLLQGPVADPAELLSGIEAELQRFVGDSPQFDDITMMAVRRSTIKT